ncbi:MAG TPA: NAD(P)-dependent oxidoreductase [Acetobacteraceae bacterium]|nr:NAD(P)-dependent oxidoreductase [Acetobacteraceae bacterium]
MTRIVITGAAGNLGTKLRRHCESLGWELRLLDAQDTGDPAIRVADLAEWNDAWAADFTGADAVFHLAASPSPRTSWEAAQRLNLDLTMNVYEAAVRAGAHRLVFASSNWVVAGHRFEAWPLRTDVEPYPVNPYGVSKLVGERLGRSYSDRSGLSVICFRIGYCQRGENRPGPHMGWGLWGQRMWLSNRDLCQGFEKAVLAPADLRFAVLNLMSRNDGMRWDLTATQDAIGYTPDDHYIPHEPDEMRGQTAAARHARRLVEATEGFIQDRRW